MISFDIVGAPQYYDVLGVRSYKSPCCNLKISVLFENISIHVCDICFFGIFQVSVTQVCPNIELWFPTKAMITMCS